MSSLNGLYVITPTLPEQRLSVDHSVGNPAVWLARIQDAIRGGAKWVQFRDKSCNKKFRIDLAHRLLTVCRKYDIPLIINDDVELAAQLQADGVHLGLHDMSLTQARQTLGKNAIIGVSCYNRLDLAISAQQAGADYVAFGRFFASKTKPDAVSAPLSLLSEARQKLQIPVVAIGGITVENASEVIQAGADATAVIDGVFSHENVYQAAAQLQQLF